MWRRLKILAKKRIVSFGFQLVKKEPNPIKWGVIGLGNMAELLATTIHGNKDAVVHAVASRTIKKAETFASRHGNCKAYGNYKDMITDTSLSLDIVYIATPVNQHYQIIKDCLLAGKNVLCEKPITSNSNEFRELTKIAKQNKCFLMEGMWMKCLPTFKKAIDWIDEGKIGEIELIRANFYKKQIVDPTLSIFNKDEGGGVLQDYGTYAISFMTTFLGGIPKLFKYNKHFSSSGIDTDWLIFGKLKNRMAFINISSNFSSESRASIIGNQGSIEWNSQFNRTDTIVLFDSFGKKLESHKFDYKYDGFEYEIEEVVRSLKQDKLESEMVPLSQTLDSLEVIDILLEKSTANE